MGNVRSIASAAARCADQRGFTLIEALTAIVVLVIGIISLFTMQQGAIQANARADSLARLSSQATDNIESRIGQILAGRLAYAEAIAMRTPDHANPVGGNSRQFGLNDPLQNGNGPDPDGAEPRYLQLGLNNCAPYENNANNLNSADLCDDTLMGGRGLVFVNIVPDQPAPDTATIRVKVVTRDFGSQAVVTSTTYFIARH